MARKTEPAQQINFRLKTATIERMERFKESHPIHPTLTQIVEAAVKQWLDAAESSPPRHDAARKPAAKR